MTDVPDALAAELEQHLDADGYTGAVQRLLEVVRTQLGMEVTWLSRFVGAEQVLEYVDAAPDARAPAAWARLPLSGSFCTRVLDGRLPSLIPDARRHPATALLDVTAELSIGAYLGVPLRGPGGLTTGMLCAINEHASPGLTDKDVQLMQRLADVLSDLAQRAASAHDRRAAEEELRTALDDVIAGHGRYPVLQPIFDIRTGRAVAAEALTRFSARSPLGVGMRSSAQWFDDADTLGLRPQLELATAQSALTLLEALPQDIAITLNLQPSTITPESLDALLRDVEPDRVVLEVTEHAVVTDYESLLRTLAPARDRGVRLAVDDAGAGFASLRHVLLCRPDLVKVDMALVRGCDADPVRQTLLRALLEFATALGAEVVAEGVESEQELLALGECGVPLAQGFGLGLPSAGPAWTWELG